MRKAIMKQMSMKQVGKRQIDTGQFITSQVRNSLKCMKKMRASIMALIIGSGVISVNAEAAGQHYAYGEVKDVEPVIERVREYRPVRVCREEVVRTSLRKNLRAEQAIGGVLGAVVGSQLGKRGPAKVAGALAGAAVGSSLGESLAKGKSQHQPNPVHQDFEKVVTRCSIEQQAEEFESIIGYKVVYQYQGQEYITELPYDPGDEIRLRVLVEPVIDND